MRRLVGMRIAPRKERARESRNDCLRLQEATIVTSRVAAANASFGTGRSWPRRI